MKTNIRDIEININTQSEKSAYFWFWVSCTKSDVDFMIDNVLINKKFDGENIIYTVTSPDGKSFIIGREEAADIADKFENTVGKIDDYNNFGNWKQVDFFTKKLTIGAEVDGKTVSCTFPLCDITADNIKNMDGQQLCVGLSCWPKVIETNFMYFGGYIDKYVRYNFNSDDPIKSTVEVFDK